ncbi:MAG TPA: ThiF family adenylyltransferase [Candidatus Scatomorpha merdavium]|nr:ThiF family adenylyltransferase [Candidatus Scatomorpha merdavium]
MTLINCGVFIAGLGGLGGYLLEHMLRLGPGFIRAADGDLFDETNLDRQLLSAPSQLGRPKAEAAAERAKLVAPGLDFEAVSEFLDGENCLRLLRGCALALDGLDNAESRLVLERGCAEVGIPLVHGAASGLCFEAGVVPPGSGMLARLYPPGRQAMDRMARGPAVAACAAIQCAQAEQILRGERPTLWGKLLTADLAGPSFDISTV